MNRKQALIHWDGGIHSSLALYEAKHSLNVHPVTLVTSINQPSNHTTTGWIPAHLIEQQCMALGLPLQPVFLSDDAGETDLLASWEVVLTPFHQSVGIEYLVGDPRRPTLGTESGMQVLDPLDHRPKSQLPSLFWNAGFRAIVTTINAAWLDGELVGSSYDEYFVQSLPPGVDPWGRNGEFYTYVYDGPLFRRPVPVVAGDRFFRRWSFSAGMQACWFVELVLVH